MFVVTAAVPETLRFVRPAAVTAPVSRLDVAFSESVVASPAVRPPRVLAEPVELTTTLTRFLDAPSLSVTPLPFVPLTAFTVAPVAASTNVAFTAPLVIVALPMMPMEVVPATLLAVTAPGAR